MTIRKFRAGRVSTVTASTWVGEPGTMFYDEATGQLKIADGVTPGGSYIPLVIATSTIAGAIKAGPGANVAVDGTLTIDTAGLPLSFGNLTAVDTTLKTVATNADLVLEASGTGNVELVGNVNFYSAAQGHTGSPYFRASSDGQLTVLVPAADPQAGAVKIVGSTTGRVSPPINAGVMLQLTGNNDDPSRLYNDAIGAFAAFVGRRINGNLTYPTAVQAGDEIIRISATGHNGTSVSGSGAARIVYQAVETFTPSATGSNISIWTCAIGSNTLSKIATFDSASGLTATKATVQANLTVTGNVVGNIYGNVIGTTASYSGNVTAANIVVTNGFYTPTTIINNGVTTTGNVTAGNVIAHTIGTLTGNVTGLVLTAAQPNITSVGTLTNLTVDGYGNGGGLTVQGNLRYDIAYGNATATQLTNKSTPVTCNGRTGQITTSGALLAKGASVTFTVNNSFVTTLTDIPIIAIQSGATIDSYAIAVTRVQVGSFNITLTNNGAGPLSDTIIINFAIMRIS